jgi:hypothetical protein
LVRRDIVSLRTGRGAFPARFALTNGSLNDGG